MFKESIEEIQEEKTRYPATGIYIATLIGYSLKIETRSAVYKYRVPCGIRGMSTVVVHVESKNKEVTYQEIMN